MAITDTSRELQLGLTREQGLAVMGWESFLADPQNTPVTYCAVDLPLGCSLVESVQDLRTRFVKHQGWLDFQPGELDLDRYDSDPNTQLFAAGLDILGHVQNNTADGLGIATKSVNSCMRLTKIPSPYDSLSFEMWGSLLDSDEFRNAYSIHSATLLESAAAGRLFDLTRLATDYESRDIADEQERAEAMLQAVKNCFLMFGAGVAHSTQEELSEEKPIDDSVDSLWLFTINDSVKALLDATGIEYHTLISGKISDGDAYNSSLCYLKVRDGVSQVRNVPNFVNARDLVQHGAVQKLQIARI